MNQQEQFRLKVGLAEMLKGGVIMDVMTSDQARIAEEAGAVAVMALERIPARIRREGGVARMSDPRLIKEIQGAVSIPVMAKCRIGHFAEAQILEALGVDFIDESEVLTPADEEHHIDKHPFKVPFVCGCRDIGEALRRRAVTRALRALGTLGDDERMAEAKKLGAPVELIREVGKSGKLPVPNFAAGGVATPADAALMVQLGAESVFVGSGIFEVGQDQKPEEARREQLRMAQAIVKAVTNWNRPQVLAEISEGLPRAMKGLSLEGLPEEQQLAKRGW